MVTPDPGSLRQIADALWDLRDHTYDHAARWEGVNAEAVFQVMAELVEAALDGGAEHLDWRGLYRDVVARLARPEG